MEASNVKGKTYKGSQIVMCPKCAAEVTKQGLGSHLRLKHGIRVSHKTKPLETMVNHSFSWDPFEAPRDLAEFLLKLFKGDEKKLISTIKSVKKEMDEDGRD